MSSAYRPLDVVVVATVVVVVVVVVVVASEVVVRGHEVADIGVGSGE
jgi:hypothetical protein